ncbi:MAG: phenylacetate--CoA ligase, partial [Bacteroidota bacterium]
AEAMDIYSEFSENYDQFIFMTNPSNINLIMHLFRERGIEPRPGATYFPVVGEFFPESFRNKVNEFFGHTGENAFTVWTGYGSADTGDVAVEIAPLIRLRNYIHARPELSDKLFDTTNTPFLMKLFPKAYVEIIDGRIVVTKDQMIPLVRYDTGDTGFIVHRDKLAAGDIPSEIIAELPEEILCISGRVDNQIIFYGTNLSLEEINDHFNNLDQNYKYGGYYEVEQIQVGEADVFRFYVHIAADPTDQLQEKYQRELISFLSTRSNEFRAKYENLSKSIGRPLIEVSLEKVDPTESKKKHKYIIKV